MIEAEKRSDRQVQQGPLLDARRRRVLALCDLRVRPRCRGSPARDQPRVRDRRAVQGREQRAVRHPGGRVSRSRSPIHTSGAARRVLQLLRRRCTASPEPPYLILEPPTFGISFVCRVRDIERGDCQELRVHDRAGLPGRPDLLVEPPSAGRAGSRAWARSTAPTRTEVAPSQACRKQDDHPLRTVAQAEGPPGGGPFKHSPVAPKGYAPAPTASGCGSEMLRGISTSRAMTRRWIWDVPSYSCMIFASRISFSTGYSLMKP